MKKTIILFSFCFFTVLIAFAQGNFPINYNQDAHYPKGDTALMVYFFKTINYSDEAIKNKVEGEAIFSLTVMPDSSITEIIPLSNIGYGIEKQVADLLKKLRYAPAIINETLYPATLIINVRINAMNNKALLIEK